MNSWVNAFAFVFKSMLPPAIENQVIETEINVNVTSEFADKRVSAECAAAEALKIVRKRIKGPGSGNSSNGASPRGGGSGYGMGSPRGFGIGEGVGIGKGVMTTSRSRLLVNS
jgi:hypothetical protein